MRFLYSLLLIVLTPNAFAGVFTPPPSDKSVEFLGNIFGPSIGSIVLGGPANPILGQLMEALNLIVVTIGMAIAGYVSIMSIVNTAQEGTVMGKKWSAVWIPMRSVMGLGLMVPAPGSGYSMIQATVMWIVIQGIGAADELWNIVLDGMENGITPIQSGPSENKSMSSEALNTLNTTSGNILRGLSCMQAFKELADVHASAPYNYDSSNSNIVKYGKNLGAYTDTSKSYEAKIIPRAPLYHAEGETTINFGYKFADTEDFDHGDWSDVCGSITIKASTDFLEVFPDADKEIAEIDDLPGVTMDKPITQLYLNHQDKVNNLYSQETVKQAAQKILDKKLLGINGMISLLSELSRNFFDGVIMPNKKIGKLYFITGDDPTSMNSYQGISERNYAQIMDTLIKPKKRERSGDKILLKAREEGWLRAGSMYFQLSKKNEKSKRDSYYKSINEEVPSFKLAENMDLDGFTDLNDFFEIRSDKSLIKFNEKVHNMDIGENYKYMASALWNAEKYINNNKAYTTANSISVSQAIIEDGALGNLQDKIESGEDVDISTEEMKAVGKDALNGITSEVSSRNAAALRSISKSLEKHGHDPIIGHTSYGYELMQQADALVFTFMALGLILGAILGLACGLELDFFFASFKGDAFCMILDLLLSIIGPVVAAIAFFMYTLGASMAIYLPIIPYMVFTVASLGWVITVVEAIIAAPLIALGMVTPAGDELGRVSHALIILANIFLRPGLMIIGFLLAGKVFAAVVEIVNWGMADNYELFENLDGVAKGSVFSPLIVQLVYVSFIGSLANKSFSLIYAVPDRVMRWLGGPAENTNVSQELEAAKSGGKTGSQATAQFGTGMAGKAHTPGQSTYKDAIAKKEAVKK